MHKTTGRCASFHTLSLCVLLSVVCVGFGCGRKDTSSQPPSEVQSGQSNDGIERPVQDPKKPPGIAQPKTNGSTDSTPRVEVPKEARDALTKALEIEKRDIAAPNADKFLEQAIKISEAATASFDEAYLRRATRATTRSLSRFQYGDAEADLLRMLPRAISGDLFADGSSGSAAALEETYWQTLAHVETALGMLGERLYTTALNEQVSYTRLKLALAEDTPAVIAQSEAPLLRFYLANSLALLGDGANAKKEFAQISDNALPGELRSWRSAWLRIINKESAATAPKGVWRDFVAAMSPTSATNAITEDTTDRQHDLASIMRQRLAIAAAAAAQKPAEPPSPLLTSAPAKNGDSPVGWLRPEWTLNTVAEGTSVSISFGDPWRFAVESRRHFALASIAWSRLGNSRKPNASESRYAALCDWMRDPVRNRQRLKTNRAAMSSATASYADRLKRPRTATERFDALQMGLTSDPGADSLTEPDASLPFEEQYATAMLLMHRATQAKTMDAGRQMTMRAATILERLRGAGVFYGGSDPLVLVPLADALWYSQKVDLAADAMKAIESALPESSPVYDLFRRTNDLLMNVAVGQSSETLNTALRWGRYSSNPGG